MPNISHNLEQIQQRVRLCAEKYHKNPDNILLLAVSKTQPAEAIIEAYQAGQRHFGENYAQELANKVQQLQALAITWHFIGPIQSNKTRLIAEHSHWVHSVERIKIAKRLSQQRPPHLPPLQVCIQVNIDQEATKAGVAPNDLTALITTIQALPNLQLRGLMAIPSQQDPTHSFTAMAKLAASHQLKTLSMGMSGDMEPAIAAGSNIVRIGTAIFGARTEGQQQ